MELSVDLEIPGGPSMAHMDHVENRWLTAVVDLTYRTSKKLNAVCKELVN